MAAAPAGDAIWRRTRRFERSVVPASALLSTQIAPPWTSTARATNAALLLHGGYGYVEEYPVGRFLRDAKLTGIGEGTSDIQRLVIGRALA